MMQIMEDIEINPKTSMISRQISSKRWFMEQGIFLLYFSIAVILTSVYLSHIITLLTNLTLAINSFEQVFDRDMTILSSYFECR